MPFQANLSAILLVLIHAMVLGQTAVPANGKDAPGTLTFHGQATAELFSKEINESFKAVLAKNYHTADHPYRPGYVTASIDRRPWFDTMWTRDGGTFMRELVLWGYLHRACLTADCLIKLVQKNSEGYYTFPEYFKGVKPGSGTELDGTASIIIAMVLLWQRLEDHDAYKSEIYAFLHQESSPLCYIHSRLQKEPLIAGSGEFGGGCGIKGEWYNVVQNNLVFLALTAAAHMEDQAKETETAQRYRRDAKMLRQNMEKYLIDADGGWIWCIDPQSLQPDTAITNHPINRGFGGLNGVACMSADVLGIDPVRADWWSASASEKTFMQLYHIPLRREQFEKYGIWSQFDVFRQGMSSGPSYGDGYALQTMLLFDKMEMAAKSLHYLAHATYAPPSEYVELERDSPYYFYERYYSPDIIGKMKMEQGCGALNLVNVTEPLKVARLILGVDDWSQSNVVQIIPRLPLDWEGYEAVNWPVKTDKGMGHAHIKLERKGDRQSFSLKLGKGERISKLQVRFSTRDGYVWKEKKGVNETAFTIGND